MMKKDRHGFTFIKLLSLAELWGWGTANRAVFNGKKYSLFDELLDKRTAESYVKKLKSIGCLARIVSQRDQGYPDEYMIYYWHDRPDNRG
jgi:hypothetical protein